MLNNVVRDLEQNSLRGVSATCKTLSATWKALSATCKTLSATWCATLGATWEIIRNLVRNLVRNLKGFVRNLAKFCPQPYGFRTAHEVTVRNLTLPLKQTFESVRLNQTLTRCRYSYSAGMTPADSWPIGTSWLNVCST